MLLWVFFLFALPTTCLHQLIDFNKLLKLSFSSRNRTKIRWNFCVILLMPTRSPFQMTRSFDRIHWLKIHQQAFKSWHFIPRLWMKVKTWPYMYTKSCTSIYIFCFIFVKTKMIHLSASILNHINKCFFSLRCKKLSVDDNNFLFINNLKIIHWERFKFVCLRHRCLPVLIPH